MIYELRTYQVQAGKAAEYAALFERVGLPIMSKYAELVGYWTGETGTLNSLYHLWRYDSLERRAQARAALYQDADWKANFLPVAMPMLVRQENTLLNPVSFSPLK